MGLPLCLEMFKAADDVSLESGLLNFHVNQNVSSSQVFIGSLFTVSYFYLFYTYHSPII